MTHDTDRLHQLLDQPWSREVAVDEDGNFIASVPELPGCFADGATREEASSRLDRVLEEWLMIALEDGDDIPSPRQLRDENFSGRFSVRLPTSLHRDLSMRADEEGTSLNQLVGVLLARSLENGDTKRRNGQSDAHEPITADAVRSGAQSIGALKGIASFLRKRGDVNLACLVYAMASVRIEAAEGQQAAAHELGMAAALARKNGMIRLAESLYEESLRRDRTNLRSASALGQLLHHQGRYREAVEYLETAAEVDRYAKLYLGWSLMFREEDRGGADVDNGLKQLIDALHQWAYHNGDRNQRSSWLRHVQRLNTLGSRFHAETERLLEFANANAGWGKLDADSVETTDAALDYTADEVLEEQGA